MLCESALRLTDILNLYQYVSNLGVSNELGMNMGLILIVYSFVFLRFLLI